MDIWTTAYRAGLFAADLWGLEKEDTAQAFCLAVHEAMQGNKFGGDVCWAARAAIRKEARISWNEAPLPEHSVVDGIVAGLRDNNFWLYHAAIDKMFELEEEGKHEEAHQLHLDIEAWLNSIDDVPPPPDYDTYLPGEDTLPGRIQEAYQDEDVAMQAVRASSNGAGYYTEDERALANENAWSAGLSDDAMRLIPFRQARDVDDWRIDRAIRAMAHYGSRPLHGLKLEQIDAILEPLNDIELARVLRGYHTIIERKFGEENADLYRDFIVEALDLDLDSEEADQILFDAPPLPEEIEVDGSIEDVMKLYELLALPPEHPEWKPWHDVIWLKAGGILHTKQDFQACRASGKRAFFKDRRESARRNRLHRMGPVLVKPDGLKRQGITDGNGRKYAWADLLKMGQHVSAVVKIVPEKRDSFVKAVMGLEDPAAHQVAAYLQEVQSNDTLCA